MVFPQTGPKAESYFFYTPFTPVHTSAGILNLGWLDAILQA